jgi:hypothetical protein
VGKSSSASRSRLSSRPVVCMARGSESHATFSMWPSRIRGRIPSFRA